MFKAQRNQGFIKIVLIIVIALIVLGFFGFNVKDIVEAPLVQNNLNYAWGLVVWVWDNYLATPAIYFWQNIFVDLFWDTFQDNITRLKNGEGEDFQNNTPSVEFN